MDARHKICLVITQPEWGGAQRYVYDLACGLKDKGYQVTVATGAGEPVLNNKLQEQHIPTHQFAHVVRPISLRSLMKDIRSIRDMSRYFRKHRFDVVHLNSSKVGVTGAIAATLAGTKKVVFTAHGFVFNEKQNVVKKWLYVCLTWFGMLWTDEVIAVSHYDRDSARRLHIVSSHKIHTIHNGIDIKDEHFIEREKAREYVAQKTGTSIASDVTLVGTIANLYPNKGLQILIESVQHVVKEIENIQFVVIGEGKERKKLEQQIAQHDLQHHMHLVGFIENPEQYLKAFDVYVSASLKEGLPYSLIEARVAGIPIVATSVSGVPEIVDDESGVLVAPDNSRALAESIVDVLKQSPVNTSHKNGFTLHNMINKTIDIYERKI